MRSNLILVGVAHRDPRGFAKLLALLRRERPDRVSLEVSRASLRYRRGAGAGKRRRLAAALARLAPGPLRDEARELLAALRVPFEVRAARAYAREAGVPVALLDLSRHARPLLVELDAWADDLLARIERPAPASDPGPGPAPRPRPPTAVAELRRAARALARPGALLPRGEGMAERDGFAARRLRAWAAAGPYVRILHVAGWEHLAIDPAGTSLAARLADLAPRRILLRARRRPCST
jgi:hypothetical protein